MSNSILNYHIEDGSPCGKNANLDEISDYYGNLLQDIKRFLERLDNERLYGNVMNVK